MNEPWDNFYLGFATALGRLIRKYKQPTMARNIMRDYQVSIEDLAKAGVPSSDLKAIKEACKPNEKADRIMNQINQRE